MCLVPKHTEVRIAKRNITAYKYLYKKDAYGIYKSPFKGFPWNLNKLVKVDTKLGGNRMSLVGKGLHAFRTLQILKSHIGYPSYIANKYCLVKVTIPKGSIYKIGERGDIVSNQMIIKKVVKW